MDYAMQNEILVKKFNFRKYNFSDPKIFTKGIGFSVKKKIDDSDNVTLLNISIINEGLVDEKKEKKSLYITATYGKEGKDSVQIRSEKTILNEPIDLESRDYSYDIKTGEFYKKNKKILADDLINEIYNLHIKPTKPIKGVFLRFQLFYYHLLLPFFFQCLSRFFYYTLLLISGDRYTYTYFFGEETLNGQVIKSKRNCGLRLSENIKENEIFKESEKFEFFGYKASLWSVVFYSAIHFFLYTIFMYRNYQPVFVTTIFKNAFLMAIYVIMSLWILERATPRLLKFLIKSFSILSIKSEMAKIHL